MKKFILKATALAIGALVAGSSMAALNFDAAVTANKYSNEIDVDAVAGLALLDGTATDLNMTATPGVSPGVNVTVYVRIDLGNGAKFVANPTSLAVSDGVISVTGAGTGALSSGGIGSSFVIYALSPTDNTESIQADATMTLTNAAGGIKVYNQGAVTGQIRVYETLTAAANPASSLALKDTTARNFITFVEGVVATVTTGSVVADVAPATGSAYTKFTPFVAAGSTLGNINMAVTAATAGGANGNTTTIGTVLKDTSDITLTGDFGLAQNDDLTFTGAALNRVFLSASAVCGAVTVPATTLTATTATFTDVAAATLLGTNYLCFQPGGTPVIAAGSYTAAINFEPQTGYTKTDTSGLAIGTITRNGTNLVAPLIQTPAGYLARLVLVNSGSIARTYAVVAKSETGTTLTLSGAAASGTLAANSTTVVDLPALVTGTGFTGAPRGSLIVTVNGPSSAIDGLYQIVNPTAGSISNHALILK